MRKRLIVGSSWKMNKTRSEARDFVVELRRTLGAFDHDLVQAYILPPFTALETVRQTLDDYPIEMGAQDVFWEDAGAFTGEISPLMLRDLGCTIVMLGHSERRQLFGETDEMLNKKVLAACRHGLTPLLCVGETLEERDAGKTIQVLREQMTLGLRGVSFALTHRVLVLYEPRWAIGEREAASLDYIQKAHQIVRAQLGDIYDSRTAFQMRIVYGGSVNLTNLVDILRLPGVDGCAISRAAWDPVNFAKMIRLTEQVSRTRRDLDIENIA